MTPEALIQTTVLMGLLVLSGGAWGVLYCLGKACPPGRDCAQEPCCCELHPGESARTRLASGEVLLPLPS